MTRERLFQRVLLRGLTQEDVERFIELTSGSMAPRGLVEAVHTQTEGNPLFVTEVVRLLVQEGELSAEKAEETDSWTIRIPEGVREVIGRRLNRLSQRCNEALTVASIIGREFTMAQLRPLVEEVTEDRLFEILEEALAARVIEELPRSVGLYQFTHALIQETLTSELSLTRRVRLHAQIAETLEKLYGSGAESHTAELAHHFSQAEAVTGTEKLVHYSILAGSRALAVLAYEEALAHFQRGLTAKGVSPMGLEPAEDEEAAALLSGLGSAQLGALDRSSSGREADSLSRAFDYYVNARDVDRAVTTALSALGTGSIPNAGRKFIETALTLVSSDSQDAGRLQALHILTLRGAADYDKSQEAFYHALSIARQRQDKVLEMQALVAVACVDPPAATSNGA